MFRDRIRACRRNPLPDGLRAPTMQASGRGQQGGLQLPAGEARPAVPDAGQPARLAARGRPRLVRARCGRQARPRPDLCPLPGRRLERAGVRAGDDDRPAPLRLRYRRALQPPDRGHCQRDVAYRIIAANQAPNHATIARYRADHEAAIRHLFDEVLRLCAAAGRGKLGLIALDGTKVADNAALAANRTADGLDAEIDTILAEAAAVDAAEDAQLGPDRGDDLPEAVADPRTRLARPRDAKGELGRAAVARQAAHEEHLARRAEAEAAADRGLRGRKPPPPARPGPR
jgi:hypothetical protein